MIDFFSSHFELSFSTDSFSTEDRHFRLAESQFLRMLGASGGYYKVKQVQYVVNPGLKAKYDECKAECGAQGEAIVVLCRMVFIYYCYFECFFFLIFFFL